MTDVGTEIAPASSLFDAREYVELLLRNIEMAHHFGQDAIRAGEDPVEVLDRTLGFICGFVAGTQAMVVPPDMVAPAEMEKAVALGRELAAKYGW